MKSLINFASKALTTAYYILVGLSGLFVAMLVVELVLKAL